MDRVAYLSRKSCGELSENIGGQPLSAVCHRWENVADCDSCPLANGFQLAHEVDEPLDGEKLHVDRNEDFVAIEQNIDGHRTVPRASVKNCEVVLSFVWLQRS